MYICNLCGHETLNSDLICDFCKKKNNNVGEQKKIKEIIKNEEKQTDKKLETQDLNKIKKTDKNIHEKEHNEALSNSDNKVHKKVAPGSTWYAVGTFLGCFIPLILIINSICYFYNSHYDEEYSEVYMKRAIVNLMLFIFVICISLKILFT